MSYADRCRICTTDDQDNDLPDPPFELPHWTIIREGDAVISWACNEHLAQECERLQRVHRDDPTRLIVTIRSVDAAIEKILARANGEARNVTDGST